MAYYRKRGCKCPNKKKCNCEAKWSFTMEGPRDPVTDERKQITRSGFATKGEAQQAAAMVLHEVTKGTHISETDMSFKDFALNVWLKEYAESGHVKESSVRVRKHETGLFLKSFERIPIKNVTKKMYQNALNEMKKRDLADNTISGAHGTGRMIFKRAIEYDMLKADPTEFARLPRTKKTVEDIENEHEIPKYLEKEDLVRFLAAAQEHGLDGDYEAFLTLAYTGIRVGELVVLRRSDVDFEEGIITITKTYYNPTNNAVKYSLMTPKTAKSKRNIEVEPNVLRALQGYIAKQNAFKMAVRNRYYDKDYIFASRNENHPGYPIFIKTVENRMARLLKLADLNQSLTPHSLRHTHTSLLAEAGVPLEDIMDRLGHQDDRTTKSVYLHVTKTRKKEASKKFGELLRNL